MSETKKSQGNDLENIFKEFDLLYHSEDNQKNKRCKVNITGATLSDNELNIGATKLIDRHVFNHTEGKIICLQLECLPSAKEFIKAWDMEHHIYMLNGIEANPNIFQCSISESTFSRNTCFLKIRSSREMFSFVEKQLLLSITAGQRDTFKAPPYEIKIVNMPISSRNFVGVKYGFTSSKDNHEQEHISFMTGAHNIISLSFSCDNLWRHGFKSVADSLEYEIVLTHPQTNDILHHTIGKLEPTEDGNHMVGGTNFNNASKLKEGKYKCVVRFLEVTQFTTELDISTDRIGHITSVVSSSEAQSMTRKAHKGAMDELEALVGLNDVKRCIKTNLNYVRLMKAREKVGLPHGKRILNMTFLGNPGTGKTTVCRLLGSLLKEIGVLSKGHVIETNREALIGQYIGESEKRTKSFIEQAKGGILFIDEAYALVYSNDNDRDFGRKVIDTLMTYLSEPNNDLIVVMAGYTKEMNHLLDSNPGLASRFPISFEFADYSLDELMQIGQLYFDTYHYQITDEARDALRGLMRKAMAIPNFGNGRYVKTLIENQIIPNMADRIASANAFTDIPALSRIECVDIPTENTIRNSKKPTIGFNVSQ